MTRTTKASRLGLKTLGHLVELALQLRWQRKQKSVCSDVVELVEKKLHPPLRI